MAEEKLLTVRDVSIILGASEREVMDLAERGSIPTYRIGGVYLRFKRHEIEEFKKRYKPLLAKVRTSPRNAIQDRVRDFFYFNDFYILALLIIVLILLVIFR